MSFGAPVLIIDDDPAMTDVMKEILEAAGHSAAIARNGFHGLKLARELKPAVIVCDMIMPNMAGSDVFRTLASDPSTAHIPRLMVTGYSNADRSCADAFLLKPFEAEGLLRLLDRMTSDSAASKKQSLSHETQWRG